MKKFLKKMSVAVTLALIMSFYMPTFSDNTAEAATLKIEVSD